MTQFTLGKNERLKSRKQIEFLFSNGEKMTVSPFRVFYSISKNEGELSTECLRVGVGVSAKKIKQAVKRNRIKRLAREAWRLQKNELKMKLNNLALRMNVFLIYTADDLPEFDFIKEKLAAVLIKLQHKTDEKNSADS